MKSRKKKQITEIESEEEAEVQQDENQEEEEKINNPIGELLVKKLSYFN